MNMGTLIGIFSVVYFFVIVALTLFANKRAAKNANDFFTASGSLGPFLIFMTSFATAFSAFAFMGQMGQVYTNGASAILNFMSYTILGYPLFHLLGKRIWYYGRKYKFVTPSDLLVERYESNIPIRFLMGLLVCVYCSIFYIVININGVAWAMETATGIDPTLVRILICVLLVVYANLGGARGAAYVDAMQVCIIILAVIALCIITFATNGGATATYEKLAQVAPDAFYPKQAAVPMITGSIVLTVSMAIWPALWMKYYAAKNLEANWAVGAGCGLGTVIVTVGAPLIIGAGLLLAYPNTDLAKDSLVVNFAIDYAPPVIAVLIIGGLVAAALSSAAGLVLLCSSVFTNDLPKCFTKEQQSKFKSTTIFWLGRIVGVIVIIISLFVSLRPMGSLVSAGIAFTYPGYLLPLPLVIGAFYWPRGNKWGAITGMAVGFIVIMLTTYVWPAPFGIAAGIWGVVTCAILYVVVSLATAKPSDETLAKFGLTDEQLKLRNSWKKS